MLNLNPRCKYIPTPLAPCRFQTAVTPTSFARARALCKCVMIYMYIDVCI